MRWYETLALALAGMMALVFAVLFGRAYTAGAEQPKAFTTPTVGIEASSVAPLLAGALAFKTVSFQEKTPKVGAEFDALDRYLAKSFPRVHSQLKHEVINGHSHLYMWTGSDSTKRPVLFLAHTDVVPVAPETERDWTHPPFAGEVRDGYIWGRGALDFKLGVIGELAAAEALLEIGFVPQRSIYFAFGQDEEIGGAEGAKKIADHLAQQAVFFEWLIDEGPAISEGVLPGVEYPLAQIGVAEKGYLSVSISAEGRTGHSALPPRSTSVGMICRSIARLEDRRMPASIDGPVGHLLDYVVPTLNLDQRLVLANRWLFWPLVIGQLGEESTTNALIRTTSAATLIHGGIKDNMLPPHAEAVVNFRIRPGDTVAKVLDYVKRVVDDPSIKVRALSEFQSEPSNETSVDSIAFRTVAGTIRQVFPDVRVGPTLLLGSTDSRHYRNLSNQIVRFSPYRLSSADRGRLHGVNERVSLDEFSQATRFYAQLITNASR